jgi:hypothetical protein
MTLKQLLYLGLVGAAASNVCAGQKEAFDACAVAKVPADKQASGLVEQIFQKLAQPPGTIFVFASTDKELADRSGAAAGDCTVGNGMERWIVYTPEVLPPGPGRDFALAHETAHHLARHLLHGTHVLTKQDELQADTYGARWLTMLGWDDQQLLDALKGLNLPLTSEGGYPSFDERKKAVMEGYSEAADVISNRNKDAIQTTLNRYADVFTKRRARELKDVWPLVPVRTANDIQGFIDSAKNLNVSIVATRWDHFATGVMVTCQQKQSYDRDGKQIRQADDINVYMVTRQGAWFISAIPESSEKWK